MLSVLLPFVVVVVVIVAVVFVRDFFLSTIIMLETVKT